MTNGQRLIHSIPWGLLRAAPGAGRHTSHWRVRWLTSLTCIPGCREGLGCSFLSHRIPPWLFLLYTTQIVHERGFLFFLCPQNGVRVCNSRFPCPQTRVLISTLQRSHDHRNCPFLCNDSNGQTMRGCNDQNDGYVALVTMD